MIEKIKSLVEEILKYQEDLFLVDLRLKEGHGNEKLLIFIDGDEGLTIDRCGRVSKKLRNRLEEHEIIEGKFTLEVSSPGLDFPLTKVRQYKKNIGRNLEVKLTDGQWIEGKLIEVTERGLGLSINENVKNLDWNGVDQSKVKISFK